MRTKVVLSAAGLALLILAPTIYFHFAPSAPALDQSVPAPVALEASAAPAAPVHHRVAGPANRGEGVPAPEAAADLSAADHDNYVITRRGELTQMGMGDDPSDLKTILSELNDKDPEIRQAALSAAIQFGSQDAIPALQNEIGWTDDPEEKVELQKAIKYLQLPTFQDFKTRLAGAATEQPGEQSPPPN